MTPYMEKVLAGQRASDAEWYEHLLAFNKRYPGGTQEILRGFTDAQGQTSYRALAQVSAALGTAQTVVDVGCGDGALTTDLREAFPDALIIGADISSDEVDSARRSIHDSRARFIQAHGAKLPFANGSIDVVVSHLALMLMPDVEHVLLEAHRLLRKDGRIAFVVDYPAGRDAASSSLMVGMMTAIRGLHADFCMENPGDSRFREREGIEEQLQRAGFAEVEIREIATSAQLTARTCWTFFERTYAIGMLEEASRKRLRSHLFEILHSEGIMMRMPLLLVTARKAS